MKSVRDFFWDTIIPAAIIIGFVYNLFLFVNGPQGARILKIARVDLAETEKSLYTLQQERAFLAQRAQRLSLNSLDYDLLDERARRLLNFAAEGEYILGTDELDQFLKLN